MITNNTYQLAKDIKDALNKKPPYLSGNLKTYLSYLPTFTENNCLKMTINAPIYDVDYWREHNIIVTIPPNPKYPDITDYAMWLNDSGAFGTKNKSMHWANRGIYNGVQMFAAKLQAQGQTVVVVNKLDIS